MSDEQSIIAQAKDRLLRPRCDDEPLDEEYEEFQDILNRAYIYREQERFDDASELLEQNMEYRKSPYQLMRVEYLLGKYYKRLEEDRVPIDYQGRWDLAGMGAQHFALAAQAADQIPDLALVALFQKCASDMWYGSYPYRKPYRKAFEAASRALNAWEKVNDRHLTPDLQFEFDLADALGVCALMLAEDEYAVGALEKAALTLLRLSDRDDFDKAVYANYDLYLEWNWAALHHSMGKYNLALKRALSARKKAKSSSKLLNFGRINDLIAEITLDCVDEGVEWRSYTRKRLLNAAERALPDALDAAKKSHDMPGYILALIAQARWLRQTPWRAEKGAVLDEVQNLVAPLELSDPLIFARAEIAWGDEYFYRCVAHPSKRSVLTARRFYQRAQRRLLDVEALGLERVAQKRLVRLFRRFG